jgi:hypothetical protein
MVERQLGDLGQARAVAPETIQFLLVHMVGHQPVAGIDPDGQGAHHLVPVGRGQGDAVRVIGVEPCRLVAAPGVHALDQQAGAAAAIGAVGRTQSVAGARHAVPFGNADSGSMRRVRVTLACMASSQRSRLRPVDMGVNCYAWRPDHRASCPTPEWSVHPCLIITSTTLLSTE